MKKYDILNKIGIILNELQDQFDYAEQNQDYINDLELELFVANAHFLTDHIEILRKLNNQQAKPLREDRLNTTAEAISATEIKPAPQTKPVTEAKWFEPVVQAAPVRQEPVPGILNFEPFKSPTPVTQPEPVAQIPEAVKAELTAEPIQPELLLEESNEQPYAEEVQPTATTVTVEEEPATIQSEPVPQPQPVEEPVVIQNHPQPHAAAPEPEPIKSPVIPEPVKAPVIIEAPDTEPAVVTINQMISAQIAAHRLGDQAEVQPVKDLKSAINLNDKLLFVRDLFNGYSMAYGEAIEILNRFTRFEEADQFLKVNYYNKNNWEAKQATADKFYALLKRRYIS